jgi:ABC-type multidrug transport system fused ATPase/permease subunit
VPPRTRQASVVTGVASGLRGSLFLIAESKLDIRLRAMLFESVAKQEVAFFDKTETGQITSRLTSDVTKVSDSVPLNVNVFLRSFVQAIGVIGFMASLNWRLTLVTFVSIPLVTVISRYYGEYYRTLSKAVCVTIFFVFLCINPVGYRHLAILWRILPNPLPSSVRNSKCWSWPYDCD